MFGPTSSQVFNNYQVLEHLILCDWNMNLNPIPVITWRIHMIEGFYSRLFIYESFASRDCNHIVEKQKCLLHKHHMHQKLNESWSGRGLDTHAYIPCLYFKSNIERDNYLILMIILENARCSNVPCPFKFNSKLCMCKCSKPWQMLIT